MHRPRPLPPRRLRRWDRPFRYNYGLFLKNRGRFEEGLQANQDAIRVGAGSNDGVLWNLAICAAGAGNGPAALQVWKGMGQKIEMGDHGLPSGPYPYAQVRLAQFPSSAQGVGGNPEAPGQEETVWMRRVSPVHGEVVSALYYDIGVDIGDLVLHDGAVIAHRTFGEERVPVFPHMKTLARGGWSTFRFAATQSREGQVADLSSALPEEATLYVHTEQFRIVCKTCWEDETVDHLEHEATEHHVVTGKLCVPPGVSLGAVRDHLDAAVEAAGDAGLRIFVPDFHAALGDDDRASVERRRKGMLGDA